MNTFELKKKRLLKDIVRVIDDEKLLDKMEKYLHRIKRSNPPCQFTPEELRAQVLQGEIDAQNGLGISHEEMRERFLNKKK